MGLRRGDKVVPKSLAPISMWKWTRGSGASAQVWYEGNYTDLQAKVPNLQKTFDSIVIERKSGDWFHLTAAQADDNVQETHEVVGSNLSQSKLFNLYIKEQFLDLGVDSTLYNGMVASIAQIVQNFKSSGGDVTYTDMQAEITRLPGVLIGDATALALRFADDLNLNGDQCLQSQYLYRHSVSISERAYFADAESLFSDVFINTDTVFSEIELREVEGIPDDFELPQKRGGDPAFWLKQPTHSTYQNNRRIVQLEYLFADEWSDLYYPDALL